ncbi:MAG TPA: hypothetical protein VNX40_05170 [Mucilaginibacter sp.]|jgi:hypothetical protein|nr:hypothetical protein [Mucilaginibacter sp.]
MIRRSQKIKTYCLFVLLAGAVVSASAQNAFKYQALLGKIDSTGFYRIMLGPDIVAKSNGDLSDIRLADGKGNFIPYVTDVKLPGVEHQIFTVFPEVHSKSRIDSGTSFVVGNLTKKPVNMLWVKLQNTTVSRTINLFGSDNLKNWYIIEENIPLQSAIVNGDGTYFQSLSFPQSSYHYLKLQVNDKNKAPIRFLQAGEYSNMEESSYYFWLESVMGFSKATKGKTTFVTVNLKEKCQVDFLQLFISEPKYFKRNVTIYSVDGQRRSLVSSADLTSGGALYLTARTRQLELKIDNGDNLPLTIDSIEISQLNHYVVCYLERGKEYKLYTGNPDANHPNYDLVFFTDSIHKVEDLIPNPATKNPIYAKPLVIVKHEHTFIIWVSIIAALLLLSLLTWKMVTEVNNKTGQA